MLSRLIVLGLLCAPLLVVAEPDHITTLASSCAACHGTNGNSAGGTPVLAGLDASHFRKQMQDFKSGARPSTVMQRHAKGLTDAEIDGLALFFSQQPRRPASLPAHPR
ncbi:c-type cytochrome [Methylobacillus flagellatus]|uniref:c-type cytochrome n=1 Tax=Methylobacillus flagellatus TaxID=405 RepID=UPI0010F567A9|nr:c-type cytochrome [Methylobacillus flagellatus]